MFAYICKFLCTYSRRKVKLVFAVIFYTLSPPRDAKRESFCFIQAKARAGHEFAFPLFAAANTNIWCDVSRLIQCIYLRQRNINLKYEHWIIISKKSLMRRAARLGGGALKYMLSNPSIWKFRFSRSACAVYQPNIISTPRTPHIYITKSTYTSQANLKCACLAHHHHHQSVYKWIRIFFFLAKIFS